MQINGNIAYEPWRSGDTLFHALFSKAAHSANDKQLVFETVTLKATLLTLVKNWPVIFAQSHNIYRENRESHNS